MERLKLYEKKLEALKRDAEELLGAAWDRGDAMDLFEYLQEVLDDLEWEVEEEPDRLLKWEFGKLLEEARMLDKEVAAYL